MDCVTTLWEDLHLELSYQQTETLTLIHLSSYQQNLNMNAGLRTLHLSYSEVFVKSVHSCTMRSNQG